MAMSILYLSRDFGLTVHHGNFILTGGLPPRQTPQKIRWGIKGYIVEGHRRYMTKYRLDLSEYGLH